jgi:hypothetical protein
MREVVGLTIVLLLLAACGGEERTETSANLDLADLGPLLHRLSPIVPGLLSDEEDIGKLVARVEGLEAGGVAARRMRHAREESQVRTEVEVRREDVDSLIVLFRGSPDLVGRIEAEIRSFVESRGK